MCNAAGEARGAFDANAVQGGMTAAAKESLSPQQRESMTRVSSMASTGKRASSKALGVNGNENGSANGDVPLKV